MKKNESLGTGRDTSSFPSAFLKILTNFKNYIVMMFNNIFYFGKLVFVKYKTREDVSPDKDFIILFYKSTKEIYQWNKLC